MLYGRNRGRWHRLKSGHVDFDKLGLGWTYCGRAVVAGSHMGNISPDEPTANRCGVCWRV